VSNFCFSVNAIRVKYLWTRVPNKILYRELRADIQRLFEKLKEYLLYTLRTPEGAGAFKVESRIEVRISQTINCELWPFYFYRLSFVSDMYLKFITVLVLQHGTLFF
jgi:hypothetical protein